MFSFSWANWSNEHLQIVDAHCSVQLPSVWSLWIDRVLIERENWIRAKSTVLWISLSSMRYLCSVVDTITISECVLSLLSCCCSARKDGEKAISAHFWPSNTLNWFRISTHSNNAWELWRHSKTNATKEERPTDEIERNRQIDEERETRGVGWRYRSISVLYWSLPLQTIYVQQTPDYPNQ